MTQLLQEAFEKTSQLPEDRQDQIARILLTVVSEKTDHPPLTEEQIEQVKASLRGAEAGEFATDDAVNEVYEKYGA